MGLGLAVTFTGRSYLLYWVVLTEQMPSHLCWITSQCRHEETNWQVFRLTRGKGTNIPFSQGASSGCHLATTAPTAERQLRIVSRAVILTNIKYYRIF